MKLPVPSASNPDTPPRRTCVGGGGERPQDELLRFVASPEGVVVFDASGKLPGRGAYVAPELGCLEVAIKRGGLARALEAKVPPTLPEQVTKLLAERFIGGLGLLKRGGRLVIGADRVKDALKAQGLAAVVIATDTSAASREAVMAAARDTPVWHAGEKDVFSAALGVENCAIIGVARAPGVDKILKWLGQWMALRGE